jgi:hypothetical protein
VGVGLCWARGSFGCQQISVGGHETMVIPHRSLGAAADPPCAMNRAVVAIIRGMDVAYEFAWVASRGRNHSGACIGHGGGGGAT